MGEVVHAPKEQPWGRSGRYRDPDGNIVELTQPGSFHHPGTDVSDAEKSSGQRSLIGLVGDQLDAVAARPFPAQCSWPELPVFTDGDE